MVNIVDVTRIVDYSIVWASTEKENCYYDIISVNHQVPDNYRGGGRNISTNLAVSTGNYNLVKVNLVGLSNVPLEVQREVVGGINDMMYNLAPFDEEYHPDIDLDNISRHPLAEIVDSIN